MHWLLMSFCFQKLIILKWTFRTADLVIPQVIDQMPRGQRMPRPMTSPAPPASANESSREGYKAEDSSQVSLGHCRHRSRRARAAAHQAQSWCNWKMAMQ